MWLSSTGVSGAPDGQAHQGGSRESEGSSAEGGFIVFGLGVASCYNQKPFYINNQSIPGLTWVPVIKMIWSSPINKKLLLMFFHWNMSNDYNWDMNNNDVAYQICLFYQIQCFQHNKEWWWADWIWE